MSSRRLLCTLATVLVLATGCISQPPPVTEPDDNTAAQASSNVALGTIPSDGQGRPGGTLVPAMARSGSTLHAAIDNPRANKILYYRVDGDGGQTNETIEVPTQPFNLVLTANPRFVFIAYRNSDNSEIHVLQRDERFGTWTEALFRPIDPGLLSPPQLAATDGEAVLAFMILVDAGLPRLDLVRLSNGVPRTYADSERISIGLGALGALSFSAVAVHGKTIGLAYSPGDGTVRYREASWEEMQDAPETTLYSDTPGAFLGQALPYVSLAFDQSGKAWAVITKIPVMSPGALQEVENDYQVLVTHAPDWKPGFTDLTNRMFNTANAGPAGLQFTALGRDGSPRVYTWNGIVQPVEIWVDGPACHTALAMGSYHAELIQVASTAAEYRVQYLNVSAAPKEPIPCG